jgi:hypothetical protein
LRPQPRRIGRPLLPSALPFLHDGCHLRIWSALSEFGLSQAREPYLCDLVSQSVRGHR